MNPYEQTVATTRGGTQQLATNKVLRNTYALLAMTLLFSAAAAGVSMVMNVSPGISLMCSVAALVLLWFVVPRTANSAAGLGVVFAITGLLGFGLGPILNHYLGMANGPQVVMMAMGGTAAIFLSLSAYVLTTRKDFNFLGGFLFAGIMVAFLGAIAVLGFSFFGVALPGVALAISAMFVLLMCGLILFETSRIINGGETNYILATVSLYVAIYNLFTSLLHLLGAFGGDD